MTETVAIRQDIRPLQIGLPQPHAQQDQDGSAVCPLIGASPLQVNCRWCALAVTRPRTHPRIISFSFYQTWEEVKHRKFDGFIITGAPVETLAYEEVTYWNEMQQIFDWTETNVHSTMNVCWGAMAAIYHFHKVPKHPLKQKAFGVYRHRNLAPSSIYLNGFSDDFQCRSRAGRRCAAPTLKSPGPEDP